MNQMYFILNKLDRMNFFFLKLIDFNGLMNCLKRNDI